MGPEQGAATAVGVGAVALPTVQAGTEPQALQLEGLQCVQTAHQLLLW